jgi:hypothetical protein
MNKEWFIFKGSHHVGPYTVAELAQFLQTGEIHEKSLVWREGAPKWESLAKVPELSQLFEQSSRIMPSHDSASEQPPQLPEQKKSIVQKNGKSVQVTLAKKAAVNIEDEMPPPLPLDAIIQLKQEKTNPSLPKIPMQEFEKTRPSTSLSSKKSTFIWSLIVSSFVAIIVWFALNEQTSSINIKVPKVMPVYAEKLQEIATLKTPAFAFTMALDLEGSTLYASTNKSGEILAVIKMQSLPKRILGTEETEIIVKGKIENHLGKFDRMQMIKGKQFVPGEYKISFSGRKMHFLNQHMSFLRGIDFFKKLNTVINYETTALIFKGTPRDFEKKMIEYTDGVIQEKTKPLSDKLERHETLLSLLNQALENYYLILDKIKKPSDISEFEKYYIAQVSPVVQSLVVDANELSQKQENSLQNNVVDVGNFKNQMLIGKQIGELASDMITQTRKQSKLTTKEKLVLKENFQKRYKLLRSQIDANINVLKENIQQVSKQ